MPELGTSLGIRMPAAKALAGSKKWNPQFWTLLHIWCRLQSPNEVDPFFGILPGLWAKDPSLCGSMWGHKGFPKGFSLATHPTVFLWAPSMGP